MLPTCKSPTTDASKCLPSEMKGTIHLTLVDDPSRICHQISSINSTEKLSNYLPEENALTLL